LLAADVAIYQVTLSKDREFLKYCDAGLALLGGFEIFFHFSLIIFELSDFSLSD
jgi:hypothetical protein